MTLHDSMIRFFVKQTVRRMDESCDGSMIHQTDEWICWMKGMAFKRKDRLN